VAYQHNHTREHGAGGWSRTRWIVTAALIAGLAVVVIVALAYSGGGGGGSGY